MSSESMSRTSRHGALAQGLGLGFALALVAGGCTERVIFADDASESGDGPTTTVSDTTDGVPPGCGDGVARGTEACDGSDLQGATCTSLGLGTGTLTCRFDCQALETEGCATTGCGNAVVDPGELCDGPDLGGQSCASLGLSGGTLACAPGCAGFDVTGCAATQCGNGLREGGETCDGADLGGATCTDLGREPGDLGCTRDCLSFDVQGCGSGCADADLGDAVGPVVASGNTNGDDDDLPLDCAAEGGADHVLRFVPPIPGQYVIDTFGSAYDTSLGVYGSCLPTSLLACNDDVEGTLESQVSLVLDAGRQVFVSVDGFVGDTGEWVLNITPPPIPPVLPCVEEDLGWATGSPVTAGDTSVEDDDLEQSCAAGMGPDRVLRFIAPASGAYGLDTLGSSYDTVLSLHDGCAPGDELACNDDVDGLTSRLDVELTAGQSVLVVIGGFGGGAGGWQLGITPP